MVEHDIAWRDFGSKFKGKLKRDGSMLTTIMREDAGKTSPKSEMVELSHPSEMRRILRRIEDLIKWSQEAKKQYKLSVNEECETPLNSFKNQTPTNQFGPQINGELSDYVSSLSEASSSGRSQISDRKIEKPLSSSLSSLSSDDSCSN